MRIAYFDCFSGVSGDMILGALIDAGLELNELEAELARLHVPGFRLQAHKTTRQGIAGTKVDVIADEHHVERHLSDIVAIVDRSSLSDDIKDAGKRVFGELAAVEARIHQRSIDEVHFHEISGLDSIVDVVGSLVGLKKLGTEAVYASKINVGGGLVECRHGTLPVPAPATLELLKGVPVYSKGAEAELATPTGAAILKNVCRGFGPMPEMTVEQVGYGAGRRELEIPNLLRLCIGQASLEKYGSDEVVVIETNIDDMNPQFYDHVMDSLLHVGALDVFLTPVQMKKNRPGILLTAMCRRERTSEVIGVLTRESTTLGVRIRETQRVSLPRSAGAVSTRFGEIRVKVARRGDGTSTMTPEYDDCKTAAREHKVPLRTVYSEVQRAWADSGAVGKEP